MVKALVFRARLGRSPAVTRARPCEEIREQLANLRGGSLGGVSCATTPRPVQVAASTASR